MSVNKNAYTEAEVISMANAVEETPSVLDWLPASKFREAVLAEIEKRKPARYVIELELTQEETSCIDNIVNHTIAFWDGTTEKRSSLVETLDIIDEEDALAEIPLYLSLDGKDVPVNKATFVIDKDELKYIVLEHKTYEL